MLRAGRASSFRPGRNLPESTETGRSRLRVNKSGCATKKRQAALSGRNRKANNAEARPYIGEERVWGDVRGFFQGSLAARPKRVLPHAGG